VALKFEPPTLHPDQRPYPDQRLRCTPISARTATPHPDQRLHCTPISARTAPRSAPTLHPDQRLHCAHTVPRSAPVPRLTPTQHPDKRPLLNYPPNSAGVIGQLLIHQPWQGFMSMPSVCDSKAAYALGIAMLYTVRSSPAAMRDITCRVVKDITPRGNMRIVKI